MSEPDKNAEILRLAEEYRTKEAAAIEANKRASAAEEQFKVLRDAALAAEDQARYASKALVNFVYSTARSNKA